MKERDILSSELETTVKNVALEKYKTAAKKVQFINEVKNGLADEIRKNPNGVKIIETPKTDKIKSFFKKLFSIL